MWTQLTFKAEEGKGQKVCGHLHWRNASKPQAFLRLGNVGSGPCLPEYCPNVHREAGKGSKPRGALELSTGGWLRGWTPHSQLHLQLPFHAPPRCTPASMPRACNTPLSRLECPPSLPASVWVSEREYCDALSLSSSLISSSLPRPFPGPQPPSWAALAREELSDSH